MALLQDANNEMDKLKIIRKKEAEKQQVAEDAKAAAKKEMAQHEEDKKQGMI